MPETQDNDNGAIGDEQLCRALADANVRERLIFSNDEIVNEVISRYLGELASASSVPIARGFSALSPLPKPKTLEDAKKIVDGV